MELRELMLGVQGGRSLICSRHTVCSGGFDLGTSEKNCTLQMGRDGRVNSTLALSLRIQSSRTVVGECNVIQLRIPVAKDTVKVIREGMCQDQLTYMWVCEGIVEGPSIPDRHRYI